MINSHRITAIFAGLLACQLAWAAPPTFDSPSPTQGGDTSR